MTFPTIKFIHTNTEPNYELQILITDKLRTLNKYLTHAKDVQIEVELEKLNNHTKGNIYRLEVNLWRSGTLFRSAVMHENFSKAIDAVRAELDKELGRFHDRRVSMFKKGARMIKQIMKREI